MSKFRGHSGQPSRRRRLLFGFILLLVGFGVPLLMFEGFLRVFMPQSYMMPRLVASETYGHALPTDTTMVEAQSGAWRFTYTVNHRGYRGPLVPLSNRYPRRNLVVLGDSYAFGEGVNDGEQFPAVLNDVLKPTFQVVNLAVPGYGLAQEIRRFYELGQLYAPSLVVLQFTDNDPDENLLSPVTTIEDGRFRFVDMSKPWGWLKWLVGHSPLQYSHAYNLIRQGAYLLLRRHNLEARGSGTEDAPSPLESERYNELLDVFVHDLRQRKIPLVFIAVNKELDRFPRIRAKLMELDHAGLLDYVEVEDWFTGVTDYQSPEGHLWGSKAHRIIGEHLGRYILEHHRPAAAIASPRPDAPPETVQSE